MQKPQTNNGRKMAGLPMERRRKRWRIRKIRGKRGAVLELYVKPLFPKVHYEVNAEISEDDPGSAIVTLNYNI